MPLLEQRPIETVDLKPEISQRNLTGLDLAVAGLAAHAVNLRYSAHKERFVTGIQRTVEAMRPAKEYYRVGSALIRHSKLLHVSSGETALDSELAYTET